MTIDKLSISSVDFITAAFVAALSWLLNEFVFFSSEFSLITKLSVLCGVFVSIIISKWRAYQFLMLITFVINVRPRNLHLVALSDRGDFEYYSPNVIGLFGVSMSTLVMALFGLLVIFHYWRTMKLSGDLAIYLLLAIVGLGFLSAFVSVSDQGQLAVGRFLTDFKYPLFLIIGFMAISVSEGPSFDEFLRYIVWLGLVLGWLFIFNFSQDFVTSDFKLGYNPSVFISIIALSILLLKGDFRQPLVLLGLVFIALASFPFTRGEQLLLAVNLLICLVATLKVHVARGFTVLLIIVSAMAGLGFVFAEFSPETIGFIQRKAELFVSAGGVLDKSSLVRVAEFQSIFTVDGWRDIYRIVLGAGFGGAAYFGDAFFGITLDFADYSADELRQGLFYSPHFFLSYWLLKFGLVGTVLISIFYALPVFGRSRGPLSLYLIFVPVLVWQGYWVPAYAFLTGVLLGLERARSLPSD